MPLNAKAEHLLTAFQHQPGVQKDHVDNLRGVINASPALVAQINAATIAGHLKHFAVLPAGSNAGGSYDGDSRTMNLPLSILATPGNGASINVGEIAFVLGHELQHGFNHAATQQAYATFHHDVEKIAKSTTAVHDYTAPVEMLIGANRRDEARAEIAGYNAIVSLAQAANPGATLDDVYKLQPSRMADFLQWDIHATPPGFRPHPDLHLNADMTLTATAGNVQAMGRHYFGKAGHDAHLGHNGNSDYTNYYGAYAVSVIAGNERAYAKPVDGKAPHATLDMKRLHLSESLVEQNGIDLGSDHKPFAYYDSSTKPPTLHHFEHTASTHTYTPVESRRAAEVPARTGYSSDPLHGQIMGGLERLDAQLGRAPDETTRQVALHLYAAARGAGLTQVTQVVPNSETADLRPGQRLFAVQGTMDDPLRRFAWIEVAEALRTPVADAVHRADAVAQHTVSMSLSPQGVPVQERTPALAIGGR